MNDGKTDPLDNEKTLPGNSGEPLSIGGMPSMRSPVRRFQAGELILGRYRIVGELGQGGMGIVYRCHDEIGGIDVALKALPPELSHNSVEMEEVRENFKLVSRLAHPNIATVRTLEKDPVSGDFYLIMECVEGVNLRQWAKAVRSGMQDPGYGIGNQKLPPATRHSTLSLDDILPLVRQIAAALDYAHSQKIIHRDVKPANVMVDFSTAKHANERESETPNNQYPITNNCEVKILDFGLAAQIHTSLSRVSQVQHGTSGTGPYMAPEQWRGQVQDAATDQYALAVMIYELLSGRPPFESHDPMVLRGAVLEEKVPMLGNISSTHWKILERALSKDRTARFDSCGEFVEALASGKVHGAGRKKSPQKTPKGTKKILVGVFGVAIALGAGTWVTKSIIENRPASEAQIISQGEIANKVSGSSAMEQARIAQEQKEAERQALAAKLDNDREDAKTQRIEAEIVQKAVKADQLSELSDTYKIVSGDTLSKIALKVYGDSSQWREIYDANQDVMKAENDLRVGQILRIAPVLEQKESDQAISTVQPQPTSGMDWVSPSTGMEFVWIDALKMWVGKYEVANGEYRKKVPGHDSKDYQGHSLNGDRQPVVYVNFDDAVAYAKWLTDQDRKSGKLPEGYEYRLPTGDEWTVFAQCGDGREYPWGNNWPPRSGQGNYCGQETKGIAGSMIDGYSDNSVVTCPVEQSVANPWGLYGVGGNVWESTTERAGGPFDAWRGASWYNGSRVNLRCSYRGVGDASYRSIRNGFRLVLSRPGPN